MKPTIPLCLLALSLVTAAHADTTTWQAGNSTWDESGDWTNGQPVAGVDFSVNNGGLVRIQSGIEGEANLGVLGAGAAESGSLSVLSSNASLTLTNELRVGDSGTGSFTLTNGTVQNTVGNIARSAGSTGTAAVSGGTWTNTDSLVVGNAGTGGLTVTGGAISNTVGNIGSGSTGIGSVTMSAGTWTNSGELRVGDFGQGTLTFNGGSIENTIGNIARSTGSTGTVTMNAGTWTNSGNLLVGNQGSGTFTLTGGMVSSQNSHVGYNPGGEGTATVSGGAWTTTGDFYIGNAGRGTVTLTDAGTITVNGGASTVYLASQSGGLGTLNFGSQDIGNPTTAGALNAAAITFGSVTGAGSVNFNQTNNLTIDAVISGAGRIFQRGTAETVLTGANSHSGGTFIIDGSLVAMHDTAFGTGGIEIDGGNAQLRVGPDVTIANAISVGSLGGRISNYGAFAESTLTGAITLGGNLSIRPVSDAPAKITITGGITGAGNVTLETSDQAAIVVSGAEVNHTGTITHTGGGTGAVTIDAAIGANVTGVTQNATSTLTLNGNSLYTGPTTVEAGTLIVNGSIVSDTTVKNGATFGGDGVVAGITLESGATLRPVDCFDADSLVWNAGATITLSLGAAGESDILELTGALAKAGSGAFAFNFLDAGWEAGQTYTIIDFDGTNFSLEDFSFLNAGDFDGNFVFNGTTLAFQLVAIPEPSTYALAFCGLLAIVVVLRRRRIQE